MKRKLLVFALGLLQVAAMVAPLFVKSRLPAAGVGLLVFTAATVAIMALTAKDRQRRPDPGRDSGG